MTQGHLLRDLLLSHSLLSSWLCRNPPAQHSSAAPAGQDCSAELLPSEVQWLDFVWKGWNTEGLSSHAKPRKLGQQPSRKGGADGPCSTQTPRVLVQNVVQVYSISKVSVQLKGHLPHATKPL